MESPRVDQSARINLATEQYVTQKYVWPAEDQHILAQFDDTSVVVYQAYNAAIGTFAAEHGYFGGAFSFTRMSWFKPNFLWMMYRSGWGTKFNQEVTLAVRLKREFFESVLKQAVPSSFDPDLYADEVGWKKAAASSDVRLQWDPDHAPSGGPLRRRAIQLGLRGDVLAKYARDAILQIEDISAFVAEQRVNATREGLERLIVPQERVYIPATLEIAHRLKLADEG